MRSLRLRTITATVAGAIALGGAGGASGQPRGSGPPPPPPQPPPREPLHHHVDDVDLPTLGAAVLERAITPYIDGVRGCWLTSVRSPRATGRLRLELVIAPDGDVTRIEVVAPGAPPAERARLATCVRKLARTWHFPIRGGSTWALLPFYFQRTPGAGAQPSCWSPRGCPPGKEVRR